MEIQGINFSPGGGAGIAGSQVESQKLTQQDFLRLFVEQLRNQNPLEPMDGTDFFTQIAQFDTLTAMREMVSAVQSLASIGELANASALVGRTITAEVPVGPDPETGFPRPPEVVSGVVERVTFESSGSVVHIENRAVPAGLIVAVS